MRTDNTPPKLWKSSRVGVRIFAVAFATMCWLSSPVNTKPASVHQAQGLNIQFDQFSPAYAAFEDEYLFGAPDSFSETLTPSVVLASETSANSPARLPQTSAAKTVALATAEEPFFQMSLGKDKTPAAVSTPENPPTTATPMATATALPAPVLLASPVAKTAGVPPPHFTMSLGPLVASQTQQPAAQTATTETQSARPTLPESERFQAHHIRGLLELEGGLAFLGALEVAWVVNGVEKKRGTILVDDASYEIDILGIRGQIVVSLFNTDDELVGEGSVDLDALRENQRLNPDAVNIAVRDIDVSLAGKVRSIYSVGSIEDHPIENAEVTLFAYEATAVTNSDGEFRFRRWQESASRTVAMASKSGFRDSIFLIDSETVAETIMLTESYLNSFFEMLRDFGFDSKVATSGLVYGAIHDQGSPVADIEVSIEGYKTVYMENYLASRERQQTDATGTFTVVGLDDGDHILRIFRGNQLIDSRVVAVENGKVSPIVIDIKTTNKRLQFVDPLENSLPQEVATRFFDGEYTVHEDPEFVQRALAGGQDPALLEFAEADGPPSSIFVGRHNRFENIPFVNRQWLQKLEAAMDLKPEDGVAFGFIEANEAYEVSVAEFEPEKVLYFDKSGETFTEPRSNMIGFVVVGLSEGLNTLVVVEPESREIHFTELVYNNAESFSLVFR